MSKAYELIAESLKEIIADLEETGGKNLSRELQLAEKQSRENKAPAERYTADSQIEARA